jgi:hypothetical protein
VTALELQWFSDGLREFEALIAAGEDGLAAELAAFIDVRTGGHAAAGRVTDAKAFERAG